jgi:hypothetical protein
MAVAGPISVDYTQAAMAAANGNRDAAPHVVEMPLTHDELRRMGATPVQANGMDVQIHIEREGGRATGSREVIISNGGNDTRSIWVSGFPIIDISVNTGAGRNADQANANALFEQTCLAIRVPMVNARLAAWGYNGYYVLRMDCEPDRKSTAPQLRLERPPATQPQPQPQPQRRGYNY